MNPSDYDARVDWDRRLKREWPFYSKLFAQRRVSTVLDCACGTGRHAILFAQNGLDVTGIDIDREMIELARKNAADAGVKVLFETAAFSELDLKFPERRFDAVICVGNSLSQLPDLAGVKDAIRNFASVCRPGGVLALHVLNYRSLLKKEMVAQPLRVVGVEGRREFFQKIFLPRVKGVDVVTVHGRECDGGWGSEVRRGVLLPIDVDDLRRFVTGSGFSRLEAHGDYSGAPFEGGSSWDLILTAVRA
jgi:SAM-dependent methyltransferase